MKERPILFSAPMVRAILDGSKTQTRRVIKPQPNGYANTLPSASVNAAWQDGFVDVACPYGQPGGRIWVRETWQGYRQTSHEYDEWEPMDSPKDRHEQPFQPVYRADGKSYPDKWFPAIHMPREFSRITLEIIGVRVERLQDISEAAAVDEGIEEVAVSIDKQCRRYRDYSGAVTWGLPAIESFRSLWGVNQRPRQLGCEPMGAGD